MSNAIINEIRQLRREVEALRALRPPPLDPGRRGRPGGRTMKIVSSEDVLPNYWLYGMRPVRLSMPPGSAMDHWEEVPGASEVLGHNLVEDGNSETHVYRGQVAIDGELTGIKPIPNGAIVWAWPEEYPADEHNPAGTAWMFEAENDPICADPE